jgi:hypothetical protein
MLLTRGEDLAKNGLYLAPASADASSGATVPEGL